MNMTYQMLRDVWPGHLPDQKPTDIDVQKVRLQRGQTYFAKRERIFVVAYGRLVETVLSDAGREAHLDEYRPGEYTPHVVGVLRAAVATVVIEVGEGWRTAMPSMRDAVLASIEGRIEDLSYRLASASCDTVLERVQQLLRRHPDLRSPTVIARRVGASREMCSKVLRDLNLEGVPS